MEDLLEFLLFLSKLYAVISFLASILLMIDGKYKKQYGTPGYYYQHSDLNGLGSVLLSLLLLVVCPLYYMVMIVYFLCHVGRR